jgi:hypothetical protein
MRLHITERDRCGYESINSSAFPKLYEFTARAIQIYYLSLLGQIPRILIVQYTYIHTYHSRFIPERVAEVSQIFLRDTHVLPKFVS